MVVPAYGAFVNKTGFEGQSSVALIPFTVKKVCGECLKEGWGRWGPDTFFCSF
jgi:hypothetical protein